MAAVGWSLVHILFLEIKKELHPALSIIFDFTSTVITIYYAIVGLTATMGVDNPLCMTTTVIRMILGLTKLAKFKSIELDDSHMGSLEIGSEALMGLTGYVCWNDMNFKCTNRLLLASLTSYSLLLPVVMFKIDVAAHGISQRSRWLFLQTTHAHQSCITRKRLPRETSGDGT